jgi:hypothetical protein
MSVRSTAQQQSSPPSFAALRRERATGASPGSARAVFNRKVSASHPRAPRYLELGFGQGLTLNIHAAACPGEFWATDFNPVHASNAWPPGPILAYLISHLPHSRSATTYPSVI